MTTDEEKERLQFAARAWFDERERIRFTARAWFEAGWASLGRRVLRLLALATVVYVVLRSHGIVSTLIGAGILASAAGALALPLSRLPTLKRLRPHGRRALCAAVALILLLGMLVGIVLAFLKPFQDQVAELTNNWPTYQPQLMKKFDDFKGWFQHQADWVQNLAPEQLRNLLEDKPELPKTAIDPSATHAPGAGMPPGMTDAVTGAFKNIGKGINSVVELILLPVLAFYFLIDGRSLRNEFVRFFARRSQQRAILGILRESGEIMRSYLLAQLILAVIAAVFIGGLLGVLGIKYALILALVAGVTRVIPVIGPLLGFIPLATLVSVHGTQTGRYDIIVWVLVAFTAMHLFESKVLTPMILGHRLHLHPVIVIVVLLIGGEFFGLLGMFLAAPVMALIRTVLMHLYVYPRRASASGTSRLRRALSPKPTSLKD